MSANLPDTTPAPEATTRSKASSREIELLTKRFVHQLSTALIFFSAAWFLLTAGVFTFNPVSPPGLIALAAGLVCLLISIIYIVRYALTSSKVRKLS